MSFDQLPSETEKVLVELVRTENPTQTLYAQYEKCTAKERFDLDCVIRELKEYGYINIKWAGNMPYIVSLTNSAKDYVKQLLEYEAQRSTQSAQEMKVNGIIFISHRSTDKEIADMLVDFFSAIGIPRNTIFCSSLPGNDINEKISGEVKSALKNSVVNIAILSRDYYQSTYCLNEAGVFWYEDKPVIPIALPEINSDNMYGFLNNEYKLRHLDIDTDISYIYDIVTKATSTQYTTMSIVIYESKKLRGRYEGFIKARDKVEPISEVTHLITLSELTTDDERIVLYYVLYKKVRKVTKADITQWLNENEIFDVNVDNAFDLLSSFDGGSIVNDTLEFGIELFRKYSADAAAIIPELKLCVDQHTTLAVDTFKHLWSSDSMGPEMKMFISYIVDEKMPYFGARWMAKGQLENVKRWESKNTLEATLSENYESCLEYFIQNGFVYESSWTSYGNPREYKLYPSLQKYLFNCPLELTKELQAVKDSHYCELPF